MSTDLKSELHVTFIFLILKLNFVTFCHLPVTLFWCIWLKLDRKTDDGDTSAHEIYTNDLDNKEKKMVELCQNIKII